MLNIATILYITYKGGIRKKLFKNDFSIESILRLFFRSALIFFKKR